MGTTIAEKIQIIKNNRDAIWQAIVDKGGNITGNFLTYADAISGISGGGNSSVKRSYVNFYDYDGTILYSYTTADFLALSSMPKLPTRDGLICQGWNYDIEDAKEYVEEYGNLNIGATYITDDGKTRLYIDVAADGRKDVPLNVCLIPEGFEPQAPAAVEADFDTIVNDGRLIIDWGDGNIEEFEGCNYYQLRHRYQEIGNYVISIATNEDYELLFGSFEANSIGMTSENRSVMLNMNGGGDIGSLYAGMLKHVEIGNNVTRISNFAFVCCGLSSIVIPNNVTSIGVFAFGECHYLSSIVIPNSVTSISEGAFGGCTSLSSIVIPNSVTNINEGTFQDCILLSSIVIPNSVTNFGVEAFYNCDSFSSIVIPNSVTSIEECAFNHCSTAKYYDFSHHTSIPTIYTSDIFGNPQDNWYILVPSHLYDTWINEPNWCDYADRIITDKSIIDNDDQSGEPTQRPDA